MSSSSINSHDLGRVVRVEYDYQYKANDGRSVKITEGQEFALIKKSNADWWQVVDKEQKKPLYVPAAYVKELQQKRFPDHPFFKKAHNALLKLGKEEVGTEQGNLSKVKKHRERLSDGPSGKERMIVVTGSREDLNVLSGFSNSSKFSEMRASTDSLDKFIENENPYDVVPVEPLAHPEEKLDKSELKSRSSDMEEPDYANLSDFSSLPAPAAGRMHQRTDSGSIVSQIEPKRGSEGKNPPAVMKKPSFRRPDLIEAQDKTPAYANLQDQSIKPALPTHHSPQSVTVEVLGDGWELQLDNETGNRYYYNPTTGAMRAKPPRNSGKSKETMSEHHLDVPEREEAPDLVPQVQLNTDVKANSKRAMRPSPLQRRKTSPARFKNSQKAPFMQRKERKNINDENLSPNENNSNNFFDAPLGEGQNSARDVGQDPTAWSSPVLPHREQESTHSRASSGTSRSLSPDGTVSNSAPSPADHAPTPTGWSKEMSSDGDTVLVNDMNGDRWIQFFDTGSGSFYYCNELTRVTVWELPQIENIAPSNKTGETDNWSSQPSSPEATPRHQRTSSSPLSSPSATKDGKKEGSSMRKSKTLDRDSYQDLNDGGDYMDTKSKSSSLPWPKKKPSKSPPVPPSANLKPRSGRPDKHMSKRMLHTQSMIIIGDDVRGMHNQIGPFSSSPFLTKADDSEVPSTSAVVRRSRMPVMKGCMT